AGNRAEWTFSGVSTLPNCRRAMAYASFMISPRGFSMGGRNVSTSIEIAMWPLLSCSFDFSLFHLYDEREIRNRTCRRTWGHIPRGAPDPRQSSLPLDSQEDD